MCRIVAWPYHHCGDDLVSVAVTTISSLDGKMGVDVRIKASSVLQPESMAVLLHGTINLPQTSHKPPHHDFGSNPFSNYIQAIYEAKSVEWHEPLIKGRGWRVVVSLQVMIDSYSRDVGINAWRKIDSDPNISSTERCWNQHKVKELKKSGCKCWVTSVSEKRHISCELNETIRADRSKGYWPVGVSFTGYHHVHIL